MSNQTQTVSQLFGRSPQVDVLSQLPQYRLAYEYPENYAPVTIENPADAIALFRALRSKDDQIGHLVANHFYVLLLRFDTVLSLQLADITIEDVRKLSIPQVARIAYISDATHLILFSTHNHNEAEDYSVAVDEVIREMPDIFDLYGLRLLDYIRTSADTELSIYAHSYSEYCPINRLVDDYNLNRNYLIR